MPLYAIYLTRSKPNNIFIDKIHKLKKNFEKYLTNSQKCFIIRPYQTEHDKQKSSD